MVKEFENDPRVVIGIMNQREPREVLEQTFRNVYLRGPIFWDEAGDIADFAYDQPDTGLPASRGFVIGPDGNVALPIFGYDPDRIIAEIRELLTGRELGDLNTDGVVDTADLLLMLAGWGACPPPPLTCRADLNGDGEVDVVDLLMLLGSWG